jgi:uncharacterized protein (TIGR00730 family)
MQLTSLCVFCGSKDGHSARYAGEAAALGAEIARRGLKLVYGGGDTGLMGTVARAASEAGGRVTGIIPSPLFAHEVANTSLENLKVVSTMHERKALMAELSDAFVALPGGYGTLEEFCEMLTWTQLGVHDKPCALVNVDGYWSPLVALFDHAVAEGFVSHVNRQLVIEASTAVGVLDALADWRPSSLPHRLETGQT